ncbi:hypothetical protein L6164_006623 [Bauhinia variegata]|uniref:Uncharacterized protein n=1 Tax=Bauhinia variegata TaxID=167791 RepID=A0ACB9PUG4_BAUVA|nr:hypothetical protein L6164_006623 [Bauhinia variegata]
MARSAKGQQEELEDDDEGHLTGNGSSSQKVKLDEANKEQRVNTHRSKHSETEQRRRSKINERFQILRDLIPQNDQKRDKASFLLEVIEYIQFLQEKLQLYEQSYQGWNQEPTKLVPWRNHHGPSENIMDHPQVLQNGSGHENNDVISSSLPSNAQNPIESNLLATTLQKGYPHGSANEAIPLTRQIHSDLFDPVVSGGMPTQHLQESLSNSENISSHPQHEEWLDRPSEGNSAVPDNSLKEHAELIVDSESISISNSYSRGILNTLTQVLRSSGVDMSQASVSVQIDVGRRANAASTSSSKSHENQYVNNGVMACSAVDYCNEESEQTLKRLRTKAS